MPKPPQRSDAAREKRFAERLRGRLASSGLTQADVARSIHVSKNSVNSWVRGRSIPNAFHIVAIAELLGASVEELMASGKPRREAQDPILRKLADPELAGILNGLAGAAPELRSIVAEAERRVGDAQENEGSG